MVVIAIIALLVAMIAPTTSRIQELGRQAVCLTNHQAMSRGLAVYESEHHAFPYNHGFYYNPRRWALGAIAPYLTGGGSKLTNLQGLDEGEFPNAYICPSADLDTIYGFNPNDKYHACYWTNTGIRCNLGWGKDLSGRAEQQGGGFVNVSDDYEPDGYDAHIQVNGNWHTTTGKCRVYSYWCGKERYPHWHNYYLPRMANVAAPAKTVFTGDSNDIWNIEGPDSQGNIKPFYYPTPPGLWDVRTGWGWFHGALGFARHDDKLLMGYLDGSASALSREYLYANYHVRGYPNPMELYGGFLTAFPPSYGCSDDRSDPRYRMHPLPQPVDKY